MALIPPYCPDTMGFSYGDKHYNTSPRAPHWVAKMGEGFWAIHHYCWALIKERRAAQPGVSKEIRDGTLRNSIAEYHYVIRHSPADFIMLPEVYLRLGDAHAGLGEFGPAREAYAEAVRRKADYWPAYLHWARVLRAAGSRKEALAHTREGLKAAPEAGALLELERELEAELKAVPRRSAD